MKPLKEKVSITFDADIVAKIKEMAEKMGGALFTNEDCAYEIVEAEMKLPLEPPAVSGEKEIISINGVDVTITPNMDAAEYKHVVLGLIFLKYVSDSFEEKYNDLKAEGYGDEEDRDEYTADNTEYIAKKALADGVIIDCSDKNINIKQRYDILCMLP